MWQQAVVSEYNVTQPAMLGDHQFKAVASALWMNSGTVPYDEGLGPKAVDRLS